MGGLVWVVEFRRAEPDLDAAATEERLDEWSAQGVGVASTNRTPPGPGDTRRCNCQRGHQTSERIPDPGLAGEFVTQLGADLQDESYPEEVNSLGRTIVRWKNQITAWHQARVSNGPTEAINNLIKRIKRIGFGFTRLGNYRIRVPLYTGKPNWDLLATVTPR